MGQNHGQILCPKLMSKFESAKPHHARRRDDEDDAGEMLFSDIIQFGACAKVDLSSHSKEGELGKDHTIVLGVDGIDLKRTYLDKLEEILVKERPTLRAILNDFANIFFNPALIIDLGFFHVLKFQIEDLRLNVNCGAYIGACFGLTRFPLIVHALVHPDFRFLDY